MMLRMAFFMKMLPENASLILLRVGAVSWQFRHVNVCFNKTLHAIVRP